MRTYVDHVDLVVAVGVFATLVGGVLLLMAADGAIGTMPMAVFAAEPRPLTVDVPGLTQETLGQAIVDTTMLDREYVGANESAVKQFNRTTVIGQHLEGEPARQLDRLRQYAADLDRAHEARTQFVLGRSIAEFTARGVRAGVLSARLMDGSYNRRMIDLAIIAKSRMDEDYRLLRDGNLGAVIVAMTQDQLSAAARSRERIGASIVRLMKVGQRYRDASERAQVQFAAAAIASIRADHTADRFQAPARSEFGGRRLPVVATEPRTLPDVSMGFLIAASAGLLGLFVAGLSLAAVSRMPEAREEELVVEAGRVYRKTA